MSAAIYGCNTQCYRSGHPRSDVTFQVPQAAHYGPFMRHVQPAWPLGPSPFRKFEAPARGSIVTHARRKWYAIFEPSPVRGVYRVWEQVQQLVSGQSNAVHKGFASEAAALEWISKLALRAKDEDATLEHLRRVILGPNYRAAALTSDSCLLASPASSISDAGGSVATDAVTSTAKPVPIPRPWQTPPIVLPVPTTPTREYYRKWYAVRFVDGGTPGVYNTWQEAEVAISGRYAEHRSFDSQAEALAYAFGSSYVGQLLAQQTQQQQQEEQLQPVPEEEEIQTAAVPGLCQTAFNGLGFDFAAATQPSSSQSEQVDLQLEYDPYNEQSDLQYGIDGDAAGSYDTEYETSEIPSWMPSSESYGLPTGLRMPVLAAWDAATSRQPLPAQPNSGDDRRSSSSSNNNLPLPAPPAMTMPLLYDAPYPSPTTPAMVLTAGRSPSRRRHDNPHHHHRSRSPIFVNFEGSHRHPLCAVSASPSSPLSSAANSDSFPAAALSTSSEFALPVLSRRAGEAWPSPTAAAASQQTRPGAENPDLNSLDPDSGIRARDGLSGNRQTGDAETAVAASRQQEYGSDKAITQVKGRRGRPRKAPIAAISPLPPDGSGAGLAAHVPPTKRPRGRPRKQPLSDASTTVIVEPEAAKRRRGRPLKAVAIQSEPVAAEMLEVKRPRGRPRRGGVPLTAASASATQPKGARRCVGVGLAAGTPAKAVGKEKIKAGAPLPPSEAVTEAAEGPVKSGRGRPRSPHQNPVRTGILTSGGWTPRGPGSLRLEADRPYILAFYWKEPPPYSPAPELQSTASTTSVPTLPPLSPRSTFSGATPGRRKKNSATTQPGSLELSYSVILLDGEDYSLVTSNAGSIRCHHPAEGTHVLLNLCVQEVVRKCGLRRVQLLGRGLRPAMCPPAATAAASWAESVRAGSTGEAAVATGVEFDVEWSLLDDEPTLSSAAKALRPMAIGRLERAKESIELMPDGAERDALLLLAARAPELQLTVERLVGEWAPRYDKCTLLSTILEVQSELYGLRRKIINSGLSATAAAAVDDATATRGAPVTATTTKGGGGHPHHQENAAGDHPRGEPASDGGSEMLLLTLRKVLGDVTGYEGLAAAHARLLVRAFVLRKLYLDLMTWVENPHERRHFLDAAAVAKTS